jgi:hypothetical protein
MAGRRPFSLTFPTSVGGLELEDNVSHGTVGGTPAGRAPILPACGNVIVFASLNPSYRPGARLPSRQARDDYLAERRRELVSGAQAEGATAPDAAILADACVNAARRVMTELLAQRAGVPYGRA